MSFIVVGARRPPSIPEHPYSTASQDVSLAKPLWAAMKFLQLGLANKAVESTRRAKVAEQILRPRFSSTALDMRYAAMLQKHFAAAETAPPRSGAAHRCRPVDMRTCCLYTLQTRYKASLACRKCRAAFVTHSRWASCSGHLFEQLAETFAAASLLRRPLASSRIAELLYVSLGCGPPPRLENA